MFRFSSTHDDSEDQNISIKDYIGRMQEGQKAIYYVSANTHAMAKNSPHLEIFKKKGIEVLLMSDPVDEWVTTHWAEVEDKPLQSVTKGELDLGDLKDEEEKKDDGKKSEENEKLSERIRKVLEEKVPNSILVPKGFAHGFSVISDTATVLYLQSKPFNKDSDSGIHYDSVNIEWNIKNPIISD